jgi:methyltransferase (TIGR00027 family)
MKPSCEDTWSLASSVAATATMVAAARAAASRQANPIINDPFAEPLVGASGGELFERLASGDLEIADIGTDCTVDYFAARTRFFDVFFTSALPSGIRQSVIFGPRPDLRSYRLEFTARTVVYEIDRPQVVAIKNCTPAGLGAPPNTALCPVGVQLRQDWPTALQRAGFDLNQPTVWLAKWLMVAHLPVHTQNRLPDRITTLSTRGNQLTGDDMPSNTRSLSGTSHARGRGQPGYDTGLGDLPDSEKHCDVEELPRAGWHGTDRTLEDLLRNAELSAHTMDIGPHAHGAIRDLTATRQ